MTEFEQVELLCRETAKLAATALIGSQGDVTRALLVVGTHDRARELASEAIRAAADDIAAALAGTLGDEQA